MKLVRLDGCLGDAGAKLDALAAAVLSRLPMAP